MDINTAKTELIKRTLSWSRQGLVWEASANFPTLTTYGLNNRYVLGFVYWFRTLDQRTQEALIEFLPRESLRLSLPDEKRWRDMVYTGSAISFNNLPPLASADINVPGFVAIDKNMLLDHIYQCLTPIYGKPTVKKGLKMEYINCFGDWRILTSIQLGSRWRSEVRYEFTIERKDDVKSDSNVLFRRTLASLWGVNNGEWWAVCSQQDLEPVTQSLVLVSERFMQGFPPLLAGLNKD